MSHRERNAAQAQIPEYGCPPGGATSAERDSALAVALDCMALFPTPDLPQVSGAIALLPAPSPFDMAVDPAGRPRSRLRALISGLPDPRRLGPYHAYVAWAYTLALDSALKLGAVSNGRVELGALAYVQFRILVSAESSATVRVRSGRLVLRGTSPSARLLAHRDLLQPSAPGALRDTGEGRAHTMAMTAGAPNMGDWPMPPMPRWMPAMPGMSSLTPPVAPFLPGAAADTLRIPDARPRSVVRLTSGDTLVLTAGLVRRTIAGRSVITYGYNGQYPGPLIETDRGASVVVRFRNAIDLPSSVHWHGVRLDNRFDGAVGITQQPVPPGDSFTYTVRFPDAGIYWYHPHVREDIQQGLGLAGNILVRDTSTRGRDTSTRGRDTSTRGRETSTRGAARFDRQEVLMLSDLLLDERGIAPFGATTPTQALMGRFGNVLLVNGEPRYDVRVQKGTVVRFYLTNAASARLYNLSFPGSTMKAVAADVSPFEHEEWVQSVVIAPAQRYIVDVAFTQAGDVPLVNRVQALAHLVGSYANEVDTLGFVHVEREPAKAKRSAPFETLHDDPAVAASVARLRRLIDAPPDHALVLTLRTRDVPAAVANMLLGINAAVDWNDGMPMMNWLTTGTQVEWVIRDAATGKENDAIDWHFRQDDVVKLRIFNDPASSHAMDHPIHIHGQRFLVVRRDGVLMTNLAWKDTVTIPAGQTVDLLVEMSNPGRWMLHCHIAEHLSAGMMAVFTVDPRTN